MSIELSLAQIRKKRTRVRVYGIVGCWGVKTPPCLCPRGSGKLSTYIAELWADVRLCSCPKRGQNRKLTGLNGMSVLPSTADVVRPHRRVRLVPTSGVQRLIPNRSVYAGIAYAGGGTV